MKTAFSNFFSFFLFFFFYPSCFTEPNTLRRKSWKSLKVQKSQYQVVLKRKHVSVRKKKRDGHRCELSVMDTEWRRGLKAWIVSTRRWKTHIRSWETSLLHRQPEETLSIGCHGTRDRSWDHKSVVLVINLKIFLGLVSTHEDAIFFQHHKQVVTVKSVTVQNIMSGLQVTMFHPLKF